LTTVGRRGLGGILRKTLRPTVGNTVGLTTPLLVRNNTVGLTTPFLVPYYIVDCPEADLDPPLAQDSEAGETRAQPGHGAVRARAAKPLVEQHGRLVVGESGRAHGPRWAGQSQAASTAHHGPSTARRRAVCRACRAYRGTSLIRTRTPLGPS
jgi:hypothetical protein